MKQLVKRRATDREYGEQYEPHSFDFPRATDTSYRSSSTYVSRHARDMSPGGKHVILNTTPFPHLTPDRDTLCCARLSVQDHIHGKLGIMVKSGKWAQGTQSPQKRLLPPTTGRLYAKVRLELECVQCLGKSEPWPRGGQP